MLLAILQLALFTTALAMRAPQIGVVSSSPVRAQVLEAAVQSVWGRYPKVVSTPPVEPGEPLAVPSTYCELANKEVSAVVSGVFGSSVSLSMAAAARSGVPLILVDPAPPYTPSHAHVLQMYPHPDVLAQVCVDLCISKDWHEAVLLYEGSARVAPLLAPDDDRLHLVARRLPPASDPALLRNQLLMLKKNGMTNFIVWCDEECGVRVLDAAQRVGLLSDRHSYIMLSLDLHTQNLEDFSYGGANITGVRLFDSNSSLVSETMRAWSLAYERMMNTTNTSEWRFVMARQPSAVVLAHNAACIIKAALRALDLRPSDFGLAPDCARGLSHLHAETLLNYIKSEEWVVEDDGTCSPCGACGGIVWKWGGERRTVALRVLELQPGGQLEVVARWMPPKPNEPDTPAMQWMRKPRAKPPPPADSMVNQTFTVLIAVSEPYVMKKESAERLSGNELYEGFCIELIERLAKFLNFNYTFVLQADGNKGYRDNVTHEWNGMIGNLIHNEDIDFAVTDLSITPDRNLVIDFTPPFMSLGISILFQAPKPPEPAVFAFMLPFSSLVWVCVGLAYIGTSLLLYVVGRLCPDEWVNPYPCLEEPTVLENQFTIANALWFNLGAILQQGSEIAPVAYGTRAVASVWWLFALVITSSYTANLATILAKKSSTELISDVKDLANNDLGITYGAMAGGSTYAFFEQSQSETFQKMFAEMSKQEMPKNIDEGIQKVKTENYAFFMESSSIEYKTRRDCSIKQVGDLLDSKGYGIAMKKGSPYRQSLSLAVLNLQEAGILREMKNNWWNEKHGGNTCNEPEKHDSDALAMNNFLGLFLVLIVGSAIGVVGSCCDLASAASKRRHLYEPPQSFCRCFWKELVFVFRFSRTEKAVRGSLLSSTTRSSRSGDALSGEEARSPSPEPTEPESPRLETPEMPKARRRTQRRRRSSQHEVNARIARHTSYSRRSYSPASSKRHDRKSYDARHS